MEKDIKRLEKLIENANVKDMDMNDCFGGEHIESLEKLLQAYKELNIYYKEQNEVNAKFIPVSLVEEKIEELKEKGESDLRTYGFAIETHLAKQVLEELLEKRK